MKFLILAVVAVVAVVQAVPNGHGGYIGRYDQGSQYGNSEHQGNQNEGHANNVASTGHNNGDVEDDVDSNTHHHQPADLNIGHLMNAVNARHQKNGDRANDQAHNDFGKNWQRSYGV